MANRSSRDVLKMTLRVYSFTWMQVAVSLVLGSVMVSPMRSPGLVSTSNVILSGVKVSSFSSRSSTDLPLSFCMMRRAGKTLVLLRTKTSFLVKRLSRS